MTNGALRTMGVQESSGLNSINSGEIRAQDVQTGADGRALYGDRVVGDRGRRRRGFGSRREGGLADESLVVYFSYKEKGHENGRIRGEVVALRDTRLDAFLYAAARHIIFGSGQRQVPSDYHVENGYRGQKYANGFQRHLVPFKMAAYRCGIRAQTFTDPCRYARISFVVVDAGLAGAGSGRTPILLHGRTACPANADEPPASPHGRTTGPGARTNRKSS